VGQRPRGWAAIIGVGLHKVAALISARSRHAEVADNYLDILDSDMPCLIPGCQVEIAIQSLAHCGVTCRFGVPWPWTPPFGVQTEVSTRERVADLTSDLGKCNGARRAPKIGCSMVLILFLRRSCEKYSGFLTVFACFEGLAGVFCSWTGIRKLFKTSRRML
jgi:hypothetical protein